LKSLSLKSILPTLCLLSAIFCNAAANHSSGALFPKTGSDTCVKKKFSVVFYFIQDTAMTRTPQKFNKETTDIIADLNTSFSPICISFENCSTVIIPHNPFNGWNKGVDNSVTGSWRTENTINIYLVDTLKEVPPQELAGYAHTQGMLSTYFTSRDVIVLANTAVPTYTTFYGTLQHTMGHLFGLHDTFSEISVPYYKGSQELVDRSNCASTGDGICDTQADPYPSTVKKDANNEFYILPDDNFMSMYGTRCKFTPQQYYKMAKFILKYKMYLH
jgi:hypothetical protein